MQNTRTFGEAIVALLEQYGVETVFGIPGVHTLELYRGLVSNRIRHVLPRHEQGAGFMADGYARATGRPGVCFLITGPGLTNAATPIAQAYSDSVPMLVISSVNEEATLGRGGGELHELPDQRKLMSTITAFSARAGSPTEFPALVARAFDVFSSARPRPVHIEVPIDIFGAEVTEEWQPRPPATRQKVDATAIAGAASLLAHSENPVIIVGGGAIGAQAVLPELARKLAAPVITTVAATGVMPATHELCLGPTLVSPATHAIINEADVVLAAGTELSLNETWGLRLALRGKLIRIDIDETQFANLYKADFALQGDATMALQAINAAISGIAGKDRLERAAGRVAMALGEFDVALKPEERLCRDAFEAIVRAVPGETLFAADMTQLAYVAHSTFRSDMPGRMLFPKGYGTLGYALPAGIGAQLGAPDKPVVVLVGDGGILYTIQEMATAAEEGLPIVVVLWNNGWLAQIRDGFIDFDIEPIAVHPAVPDFAMLARGFGWKAVQARSFSQISESVAEALAEARQSARPVLVEVLVDALGEGRPSGVISLA